MLLGAHRVDAFNMGRARCEALPYFGTPVKGVSVAQPSDGAG